MYKEKEYPPLDKEVLEGKNPLPDYISEPIERYQGSGRYINPYIKDPKDPSKNLFSPHMETMDYYTQKKPKEQKRQQEAGKWGIAATELFDINPKTLEMVPKKNPEQSQKYFDILKRKAETFSQSTDPKNIIATNESGIETVGTDPRYSSIGLRFDPSTGTMEKVYNQNAEARSLAEIDAMENAVTGLRDAYKKAGQEMPLSKQKEITQKIIEKYKAHSKRFGGNI